MLPSCFGISPWAICIQEGGPNFLQKTNSTQRLNYLVPLPHFNFKKLKDLNFCSFITFQCILHDAAVLFPVFQNFVKSKRGDLIFSGEPILQNGWIIWSRLLYFTFNNLSDPKSSSFVTFQYILHDSAVLFSFFKNFL